MPGYFDPRGLSENSLLRKYFLSKDWLKQLCGKIFGKNN